MSDRPRRGDRLDFIAAEVEFLVCFWAFFLVEKTLKRGAFALKMQTYGAFWGEKSAL